METKILIIILIIIGLGAGGFHVWKNISGPEEKKKEIGKEEVSLMVEEKEEEKKILEAPEEKEEEKKEEIVPEEKVEKKIPEKKEEIIAPYTLLSERPDLEHYPNLLSVLSEASKFKTELSDNERQILDRIVDAYEKLTPLEQASLMFSSSITDRPFISKGDVLYWVATEFLDRTDLREDDAAIWLSYAAVFDDFFEVKTKNQEEVNWIKEYMARQYEFFGRKKLIAIGEKYDGTIGIIHVINPVLFGIEHGNLSEIFITIKAYENLKEYMLTNYWDDGKNLEQVLQENPSLEGLQIVRSYISSRHIGKYGTLEFKENFLDYYNTVVKKVFNQEKQPGTCVTKARLVVLGSRAAGIPVGLCGNAPPLPHIGTYIIYNTSIIPDMEVKNPIECSIKGWPTATYCRGYGGYSRTYALKDCVNPPDIQSYIMPIKDIVSVIEEIYNRPY